MELESSSSDPSLAKLLEDSLGLELAANIEQARSSELLAEAEETARRFIDYSLVPEQQDIDAQQAQSSSGLIPQGKQPLSPELIQGSSPLTEAHQGLQKVEDTEAALRQLLANGQEDVPKDENL